VPRRLARADCDQIHTIPDLIANGVCFHVCPTVPTGDVAVCGVCFRNGGPVALALACRAHSADMFVPCFIGVGSSESCVCDSCNSAQALVVWDNASRSRWCRSCLREGQAVHAVWHHTSQLSFFLNTAAPHGVVSVKGSVLSLQTMRLTHGTVRATFPTMRVSESGRAPGYRVVVERSAAPDTIRTCRRCVRAALSSNSEPPSCGHAEALWYGYVDATPTVPECDVCATRQDGNIMVSDAGGAVCFTCEDALHRIRPQRMITLRAPAAADRKVRECWTFIDAIVGVYQPDATPVLSER